MGNEIKLQKYRKLSVASLVTGILGISIIVLYNFLWMPISNFLRNTVDVSFIPIIILPFIAIAICLAIVAVVCGSIDLHRIKRKFYERKGKGFDIAGIVMGGTVVLVAIVFMLGELIFPH